MVVEEGWGKEDEGDLSVKSCLRRVERDVIVMAISELGVGMHSTGRMER